MNDVLAIVLLFILVGSCTMKIPYEIDGIKHQLILNP